MPGGAAHPRRFARRAERAFAARATGLSSDADKSKALPKHTIGIARAFDCLRTLRTAGLGRPKSCKQVLERAQGRNGQRGGVVRCVTGYR